jgi:hypothetical protein
MRGETKQENEAEWKQEREKEAWVRRRKTPSHQKSD